MIYERIAEARRVQLHCRIGECKEQMYEVRAPELASELAVHFEMGCDYPRAVRYVTLRARLQAAPGPPRGYSPLDQRDRAALHPPRDA